MDALERCGTRWLEALRSLLRSVLLKFESTGRNDITLATVGNPASASPSVKYQRVTTSSMPDLNNANNPLQAGLLGDYMWVAVDDHGRANVVWADTRGLNGNVEEDIYFARVP